MRRKRLFETLRITRGRCSARRVNSCEGRHRTRPIASAERFRDIVVKAGADGLIANHTAFDDSKRKISLLANRKPGDPHPYVVGKDVVRAYLTVATECSAAAQLLPEEYKGYLGRR